MTGFQQLLSNYLGTWNFFSPDGLWSSNINFAPDIPVFPDFPDISVSWTCDDQGICTGQGSRSFGGSLDGQLYYWNGTANILEATFTGSILTGSIYRQQQSCPDDICLSYIADSYYYNFAGVWTNGWQTSGDAYVSVSTDGGVGGTGLVATNTPEPGTIMLLGLGIAGFYPRLRRRI
jgi:hypothetical protein